MNEARYRSILLAVVVALVCLPFLPTARAQTSSLDPTAVQLNCSSPCTPDGVSSVAMNNSIPTFSVGVPSSGSGPDGTTALLSPVTANPGSEPLVFSASGSLTENSSLQTGSPSAASSFVGVTVVATSYTPPNASLTAPAQVLNGGPIRMTGPDPVVDEPVGGSVVPEPGSLLLFGSGLILLGGITRRHRNKQRPTA